ncbi:MAG: hypothetical protein EOO04_23805 [Chitinophagaceae bacterium]|nr:MAG: hypothetical protein EOO04_23805 [Chitinophagaceae bacterium]
MSSLLICLFFTLPAASSHFNLRLIIFNRKVAQALIPAGIAPDAQERFLDHTDYTRAVFSRYAGVITSGAVLAVPLSFPCPTVQHPFTQIGIMNVGGNLGQLGHQAAFRRVDNIQVVNNKCFQIFRT